MPYEALDHGLSQVDVVLSSTGAPHYLITRERLDKVMHTRKGRPLLIVDMAVPRDVEPSCEELENVYLYNIDDLQQVVAESLSRRHSEVQKVLEIITLESAAFARYLDTRKASTAIRALRSNFEQLVEGELQRFLSKQQCGPAEADNLKQFSEQLINKLLHEPTLRLRQLGSGGVPPEELTRTLQILGLSLENP
jgi:glutamyl-tRNA reductase